MIYYLISTILFVAIVYFLVSLILHAGLSSKILKIKTKPTVSILIAARNEEMLLPKCLESLTKIDYPLEKLKIYIINDSSKDATEEIAKEYTNRYKHFQLINISNKLPGLDGKMNALCQGIDHTDGEIILITDADCIVPPNWVSDMVS